MWRLRGLDDSIRMHAALCLQWAAEHGVHVDVTSGLRSGREQAELYARHKRCVREGRYPWAPGCEYPAAPPGLSAHQYGLAWDSTVDPVYRRWWIGVRRAVGFRVPEHDHIHAEHPEFRAWRASIRDSTG